MTPIERGIALAITRAALARGWRITVHNGAAGIALRESSDEAAVMAALDSAAADTLLRFTRQQRELGGWVMLMWSNEADLVYDASANRETTAILAIAKASTDWPAEALG